MKTVDSLEVIYSSCCCYGSGCTVRYVYDREENDLYIETLAGGKTFWHRVKGVLKYLFHGGDFYFSDCLFDNKQADKMIELFCGISVAEKTKE